MQERVFIDWMGIDGCKAKCLDYDKYMAWLGMNGWLISISKWIDLFYLNIAFAVCYVCKWICISLRTDSFMSIVIFYFLHQAADTII